MAKTTRWKFKHEHDATWVSVGLDGMRRSLLRRIQRGGAGPQRPAEMRQWATVLEHAIEKLGPAVRREQRKAGFDV